MLNNAVTGFHVKMSQKKKYGDCTRFRVRNKTSQAVASGEF